MRAKQMSSLLSLSVQFYLLARDEQFREDIAKLISSVKRKTGQMLEKMQTEKQETFCSAYQRISEAGNEIENKLDHAVRGLYSKLHLVHESEVHKLSTELAKLTTEFNALAEKFDKQQEKK